MAPTPHVDQPAAQPVPDIVRIDPVSPSPAAVEPATSATAQAAPPVADRHDLSDLLAQLSGDESDTDLAMAPAVGAKLTDPRDLERPTNTAAVEITATGGLEFDPTLASFIKRAIGFMIDTLLLAAAMLPGFLVAGLGGSAVLIFIGLVVAVAGFTAVNVVAGRAIASDRQWIGNRVAGTYVVDAVNGSNLDFARAFTRLVVRHLFSPILLFGFITALFDGHRRAFHDRVSTSLVTTRQREVWTVD